MLTVAVAENLVRLGAVWPAGFKVTVLDMVSIEFAVR